MIEPLLAGSGKIDFFVSIDRLFPWRRSLCGGWTLDRVEVGGWGGWGRCFGVWLRVSLPSLVVRWEIARLLFVACPPPLSLSVPLRRVGF